MKGQSQVVSVVIIVLLVSASVATILPWGTKVIQKKKDVKSLDDSYNFFISLDKAVRDVAKNGGEQTLDLDVPGVIEVYPNSSSDQFNNSITFYFRSKASNIAPGGWIPLNTPNTNETAVLSIDYPSVIFGKSEMGEDQITVRYRLWYRELYDKQTDHGYKIILKTTDGQKKATTSGFVKIQRLGSQTVMQGAKEMTYTNINIIV
jgi:hypothetical protein